jgi:hypothetical protein
MTIDAMMELGLTQLGDAHEIYAYVAQYGIEGMTYDEVLNLAFDAMNEVVYA